MATSSLFTFIEEGKSNQEISALRDVGTLLFNEVIMASTVQDSYQRYFELPGDVEGVEYVITINPYLPPTSNNSEIVLSFPELVDNKGYERVIVLYNVDVRSLEQGCNKIRKDDGNIVIVKAYQEECS
jgi:hypothetical protein